MTTDNYGWNNTIQTTDAVDVVTQINNTLDDIDADIKRITDRNTTGLNRGFYVLTQSGKSLSSGSSAEFNALTITDSYGTDGVVSLSAGRPTFSSGLWRINYVFRVNFSSTTFTSGRVASIWFNNNSSNEIPQAASRMSMGNSNMSGIRLPGLVWLRGTFYLVSDIGASIDQEVHPADDISIQLLQLNSASGPLTGAAFIYCEYVRPLE